MAGALVATLEGWTVGPIHAYAISSCGLSWGCFGRAAGGSQLSTGTGSSVEADCISQGDAGILYAINGVCHQAANRILYSAGINVSGAGGYGQSVFLYGVNGRTAPRRPDTSFVYQITRCVPQVGVGSKPGAGMKHLSNSGQRVSMATIDDSDTDNTRLAELSDLVRNRLGEKLDTETFEQLAEIQFQLQVEQKTLAISLLDDRISRERYLEDLLKLTRTTNDRIIRLLGRQAFERIFGDPELSGELIDREVFLGQKLRNL